jgi:hypothetical protein
MKANHIIAMFILAAAELVVVIVLEASIIAIREFRNILQARNKFL